GLICDGTGWGTDGAVWGCEVLRGDCQQFERLAHLEYRPLPGGDLTARKPYRMAYIYLLETLGEEAAAIAQQFLPALGREERDIMGQLWRKGQPEIQTSSCGRLFDAVAALLGICSVNQYEGQAAMELEARSDTKQKGHYGFGLQKPGSIWQMDVNSMWPELLDDLQRGLPVAGIAQKFHHTLVELFFHTLSRMRDATGLNRVVLSGGVFHNQIILLQLVQRLKSNDFLVYQPQLVPPGDGGIALGQAIIASEVIS
ncbi:MAG: carbamoyltransferase HypF, partial [Firmicutes bacterium]|nr:carbamoyltransferase HypF [Bacillota bacterium]